MGIFALTSCSEHDDDAAAVQGVTLMDDNMTSLTVMFSQSGPGDNGYNDLMAEGIAPFGDDQSIAMHTLRPASTTEAKMLLDKWLTDTQNREQRSLLVMAGSDYEKLAAGMAPLTDGKRSVLLVESESESLPNGVSTANIDRKSVFYLAGAMAARNDAYIVAAMRGDKIVDASIKAFKDGYAKYGTKEGLADVFYLSEEDELIPEWGYNKPDKAYELIRKIATERKQVSAQTKDILKSRFILLPLAGASNYGAYMVAMEEDINGKTPMGIIGMDKDYSGQIDLAPFSVVLKVDKMLHSCISSWIKGEELPKHRTFTLSEGFADVVVNPLFDRSTYFAFDEDRENWYIDEETGETVYATKPIDEQYWTNKYKELKEEAISYGK